MFIEFKYEDEGNTTLIEVSPSERIEFPKNVVRIKDCSVVDKQPDICPLSSLRNVLQYLSFEEESLLESLGIGTFSSFSKLIIANLSMCNHLKSISSGAFKNSNLNQVFLPMNGELANINSAAFQNTKLKSFTLPDSVINIQGYIDNEIEGGVFTACTSLHNLEISKNSLLKYIGYAIGQSASIENIFIPQNCKISTGSFNLMRNLNVTIDSRNKNIRIYDNCIYSYDYKSLFWIPNLYPNFFTFNPNCQIVESEAFRGYESNFDLLIPSFLTTIKPYGFFGCFSKSIIFQNDNIQTLDVLIFHWCASVIKMSPKLMVVKSGIFNTYLGSYVEFDSELQKIESKSFIDCKNLQKIKFIKLKSNLIIDSDSFKNCPKLEHLVFPLESSDVITFNSSCLSQCDAFKGVKFYVLVPRNVINFNVSKTNLDVEVDTINVDNDYIKCGKIHMKHPFDDKCHLNIRSSNIFYSSFNLQYLIIFIIILSE